MSKHSNAESIIATVLNEVASAFPDDTPKNVRELLDHGEPGVALEVLYAQLIEYQIEFSPDLKSRMRTAADLMGMSIANLDGASE
ncbi:MafI family immunity protein [Cupriavidus sp. SIMBA_020]|uniref:MafI family immunity protein n=1 Tax=Cupriavidus sp. SIMBA_020 TaxID=3085766 RepID=UPI0039791B4F